nr:uncharacterized protein LOC129258299 isoform X3 [Lytechinus pictus]
MPQTKAKRAAEKAPDRSTDKTSEKAVEKNSEKASEETSDKASENVPEKTVEKVIKKRIRSDDQREKNGVHVFLGAKDFPRWCALKNKSGCKTNVQLMRWLLSMAEKYIGIYCQEDIKTNEKSDPGSAGDGSVTVGNPKSEVTPVSTVKDEEPPSTSREEPTRSPRAKRKASRKSMPDGKSHEDQDTEKTQTNESKDGEQPSSSARAKTRSPRTKRKGIQKSLLDSKTDKTNEEPAPEESPVNDDNEPDHRGAAEAPRTRKTVRKALSDQKSKSDKRTKQSVGTPSIDGDDTSQVKDSKTRSQVPLKGRSRRLTKQRQVLQKDVKKPVSTRNTKAPLKRKAKENLPAAKNKKAVEKLDEKMEEAMTKDKGECSDLTADSKLSRCTVRLSSLDKEEITKIEDPKGNKSSPPKDKEITKIEDPKGNKSSPPKDKEEITKIENPKGNKSSPPKAQPKKTANTKQKKSPRELRAVARAKAAAKAAQVHRCPECLKTFSNRANLKRHCELHSSLSYPCPECGKSCKSSAQLWAHKRRLHVHKYDCPYCDKKFGLPSLLAKHRKSHAEEKLLNDQAKFHRAQEPSIQEHSVQEESIKKHSVQELGVQEHNVQEQSVHEQRIQEQNVQERSVQEHSIEEPCLCHLCGMSFKKRDEMNDHVCQANKPSEDLIDHNIQTNEPPDAPGDLNVQISQMNKSSECDKTYKPEESLINHMEPQKKTADVDLPYSCHICNKMFKTKKGMKGHVNRHDRSETFQCDTCQKVFSCKNHLQRHKLVHSDTKPYHCPECNRGFTQSSNMETHRRIHSGDKPFTCDLCGETFRQNVTLKTHKQKAHGINIWNETPTAPHVGRPTITKTAEPKVKKPRGRKGAKKSQIPLPAPLTVLRVPPLEPQIQQSSEIQSVPSQGISHSHEHNEKVQTEEKQVKSPQENTILHQAKESGDLSMKNQPAECQAQPNHQELQSHVGGQPQEHPNADPSRHQQDTGHNQHPINQQQQQPPTETQHQQHQPGQQQQQAEQHQQEQLQHESQNHYIQLQRPNPVHQQPLAPHPQTQQPQTQRQPEDQYQPAKQHQKDDSRNNSDNQQAHQQQLQPYQQGNYGKVSQQYQPPELQHQQPQPLQYQQPQLPQHQHYQQKEFVALQDRNNGPFSHEIRSYQRESITTSNYYSHYMQSSKISSGWSPSLPPPPSQPINPPPPLNRTNEPTTSHHMPMPLMQNNSPPSHRSTPGANTHHHLQALLDLESNIGNGAPARQAPVSSAGATIQSPPPTPIQHSRSSPSPSPQESSRPPSKGPQFQNLFHSPQASPLSSTFPSNHLNLRPPLNNSIPSNYPIPCPSPRPLSPFYAPTGAPYQGATREMISSQTHEPDHAHSAPLRPWYMGPPDTGNQPAPLALAGMHYPSSMGAQAQPRMPYMGYPNAPMPFPLPGNPTPPSQQRWGH